MPNEVNEITAEGMLCLLAALGYERCRFSGAYVHPNLKSVRPEQDDDLGLVWLKEDSCQFVLACLRFLESEKVREVIRFEMDFDRITLTHRSKADRSFSHDPDPAVRIVKAAIAAARELEGG